MECVYGSEIEVLAVAEAIETNPIIVVDLRTIRLIRLGVNTDAAEAERDILPFQCRLLSSVRPVRRTASPFTVARTGQLDVTCLRKTATVLPKLRAVATRWHANDEFIPGVHGKTVRCCIAKGQVLPNMVVTVVRNGLRNLLPR